MSTAPVNHRKQSAAPAAVAEAARYAIQVADHYCEWLAANAFDAVRGLPPGSLAGLRVLEIGAGSTLGTPVLLACAGARVVTADRFLPTWDTDFHGTFFEELLRQVENRGADYVRPIEEVLHAEGFAAAIECHPVAAEQVAEIAGDFDVVYSNAVLEHVADLHATALNLATVTRVRGYGFHQVDLRDHRNFDRPLEYLTMPVSEFQDLRRQCHCECGATWRASDVAAAFEEVGFAVRTTHNMTAAAEYLEDVRPRLQPEFAQRSDADLSTISGFFAMTRR